MASGKMVDPNMPLDFQSFFSELARLAATLPLAAKVARHERPFSALPYLHLPDLESKIAVAYLNDLMTQGTETLVQRWFLPEAFQLYFDGRIRLEEMMIARKSSVVKTVPHNSYRPIYETVNTSEPFMRFSIEEAVR